MVLGGGEEKGVELEKFGELKCRERELQYKGLKANVLTPKPELGGWFYRPKRGRKGGKKGGEN